MKQNRRKQTVEHSSKDGFFNLFQEKYISKPIEIELESTSPTQQIKEIFRKQIRPKELILEQENKDFIAFFTTLSLEERIVYLVNVLEKSLKKGSIFRFLWHKTEWIIAFGQVLEYLKETELSNLYHQIILDTTDFDLKTLPNNHQTLFELDIFPDASKEYASVTAFDKLFDFEVFSKKVLDKICLKQQKHLE